MAARLARFYPGADPWRWLSEIPLGIVRASLRMMPQLTAQESLRMARCVSVGAPSFDEATAAGKSWTSKQWQAQAFPQTVSAEAASTRRAGVIQSSGVKVFGPKPHA